MTLPSPLPANAGGQLVAMRRARHEVQPATWNPLELPSTRSRSTLAEVRRLARHDWVHVCLVGPSGTGKSHYARELHACSPRSDGPFVLLNLAGITKGFAASDLLGHVRGAFTGASDRRPGGVQAAHGGTLVLDEITKATRSVQHILLQLFDRGPVRPLGSDREVPLDVRLVALTSTPPDDAVGSGELIPDLYERLKPFVVEIAPLSSRREDIEAIVRYVVAHQHARFGFAKPPRIGDDLLEALGHYAFTGNHRELDGIIQRALVNADGAEEIRAMHLPISAERGAETRATSTRERYFALQATGDPPRFATVAAEAKYHGVSPSTLHRWRAQLASARRGESS